MVRKPAAVALAGWPAVREVGGPLGERKILDRAGYTCETKESREMERKIACNAGASLAAALSADRPESWLYRATSGLAWISTEENPPNGER